MAFDTFTGKSKICILLAVVLFFGCERNQIATNSRIYIGETVTIKYTGEISNGDWIRIDTILFIHKVDFDPEKDTNILMDSLNTNGTRVYFFKVPASKRIFKIDGQKNVEANVPASGILATIVNTLGTLNSTVPMYRANIGANLWLNNSLTILPADSGRKICIEVPLPYKATIETKK